MCELCLLAGASYHHLACASLSRFKPFSWVTKKETKRKIEGLPFANINIHELSIVNYKRTSKYQNSSYNFFNDLQSHPCCQLTLMGQHLSIFWDPTHILGTDGSLYILISSSFPFFSVFFFSFHGWWVKALCRTKVVWANFDGILGVKLVELVKSYGLIFLSCDKDYDMVGLILIRDGVWRWCPPCGSILLFKNWLYPECRRDKIVKNQSLTLKES